MPPPRRRASCCSPSWPRCTTPSRRRGPCAATCRCSTARRRSTTSPTVRERTLRGAGASAAPATASCVELVLRHEQQHGETMLQAIEHARLLASAPRWTPAPRPAGAGRRTAGWRASRSPAARARSAPAASASPTTTSARATAVELPRLPDRPHAGHQRHLAALRRGRRLRAPRVVERRGLVVEGGLRHHPPRWLGPRPGRLAAVADRRMGAACTPTSPWSTCPGSRPMPSPAHTAPASRRRPSGRRRRPGTRPRDGPAATRGATSRPARGGPTSTRPASARIPPARTPRARRRAARSACSATSGSGPRASSAATTGFVAHPYREYSEVFFGRGYKVAARRLLGEPRARHHRHDAQLGPAAAPPDLRRRPAGVGRMSLIGVHPGGPSARTLRDDVLDGLTRPSKELPPEHRHPIRRAPRPASPAAPGSSIPRCGVVDSII